MSKIQVHIQQGKERTFPRFAAASVLRQCLSFKICLTAKKEAPELWLSLSQKPYLVPPSFSAPPVFYSICKQSIGYTKRLRMNLRSILYGRPCLLFGAECRLAGRLILSLTVTKGCFSPASQSRLHLCVRCWQYFLLDQDGVAYQMTRIGNVGKPPSINPDLSLALTRNPAFHRA